jgi:serine/threonine-protein kinase RsbW
VPSTRLQAATSLRLPFAPSSVAVARGHLHAWLTEVGASREMVDDARVVLSELLANSVRHARPLADGSVLVSWSLDGDVVRLSVTDGGGQTRPQPLHAPSSAVAGRGMAIVDTLADRWWTEHTGSRATVHAVLPV